MKENTFRCKHVPLTKNKSGEIQLSRWKESKIFDFDFHIRRKNQDHTGFDLSVTLFFYEFRIAFYDHRHAGKK